MLDFPLLSNVVTEDTEFLWNVKEVISNAICVLVTRGQSRLDPITFTGDRITSALLKTLKIYRAAKEVVKTEHPEYYTDDACNAPIVGANWKKLQILIAEEFRKHGRLHAMFGLRPTKTTPNSTNPSSCATNTTSTVRIPDALGVELLPTLNEDEFFNAERIKECEIRYCRHLGSLLFPILICHEDDQKCKSIRSLVRELLGNSILFPVFGLFVPTTLNYWIGLGRGCDIIAGLWQAWELKEKAREELLTQQARQLELLNKGEWGLLGGPGAGLGPSGVLDKGEVVSKEMAMGTAVNHPFACAPPGFAVESSWRYLGGLISTDEAELLLQGKEVGTFLIRSLDMTDYYGISFVHKKSALAATAAAIVESSAEIEATPLEGNKNLDIVSPDMGMASTVPSTEPNTAPEMIQEAETETKSKNSINEFISVEGSGKIVLDNVVRHVLFLATTYPQDMKQNLFELLVTGMEADDYPDEIVSNSLNDFLNKCESFAKEGIVFSSDAQGHRIPKIVVPPDYKLRRVGEMEAKSGRSSRSTSVCTEDTQNTAERNRNGAAMLSRDALDPDGFAVVANAEDHNEISGKFIPLEDFDSEIEEDHNEVLNRSVQHALTASENDSGDNEDKESNIKSNLKSGQENFNDDFRYEAERAYLVGELSGAIDEYQATVDYFKNNPSSFVEDGNDEYGGHPAVVIYDIKGCQSVGRILTIIENILCYGSVESSIDTSAVNNINNDTTVVLTVYDYFRDISAMLLSYDEDSVNLESLLSSVQHILESLSLSLTVEDVVNEPLLFSNNECSESMSAVDASGNNVVEADVVGTESGGRRGALAYESVSKVSNSISTIHDSTSNSGSNSDQTPSNRKLLRLRDSRNKLRALLYHLLSTGVLTTCLEDMLADVQSYQCGNADTILAQRYWNKTSFAFASSNGDALRTIIQLCKPLHGVRIAIHIEKHSRKKPAIDVGSGLTSKAINFMAMPGKMLNTAVKSMNNVLASNEDAHSTNHNAKANSNNPYSVTAVASAGQVNDVVLQFHRNVDILEISRVRRDLTNKAWKSRRSSMAIGKSSLDGKESDEEEEGAVTNNPNEEDSLPSLSSLPSIPTMASMSSMKFFKKSGSSAAGSEVQNPKTRNALDDLSKKKASAYAKKAEKMFQVSSLLRDRPSISVLCDRGIWKAAPMKLTATITVVEKRETYVKTTMKSITGGTQSVLIYRINVQLECNQDLASISPLDNEIKTVASSKPPSSINGTSATEVANMVHSWEVIRRYSDFEDLHKALKLSAQSVLTAKNYHLPPKHNLSGAFSKQFMEKRKHKLQCYMNGVIECLPSCDEMVVFLSPDGMGSVSPTLGSINSTSLNTTIVLRHPSELEYGIQRCNAFSLLPVVSSTTSSSIFSAIANGLDADRSTFIGTSAPVLINHSQYEAVNEQANSSPAGSYNQNQMGHQMMSANMDSSTHCNNDPKQEVGSLGSNTHKEPNGSIAGSGTDCKHGNTPLMPSPAEGETYIPFVDGEPVSNNNSIPVAGAVDHKIDMAILDKRLYPLLKELLDAKHMNSIRRNLLTIALSSIKVLFSNEISKWMAKQSVVRV